MDGGWPWNTITYILPFQMNTYIFSLISQKQRQMIRGVCRLWKHVVDEMSTAVINNENYQRATQLTDVYIVKVHNFTTEFQAAVMFKHIRRLEFCNIVVSYNLFHLLRECSGVLELVFANVTLDSHKKMKCLEKLTFPEVKVITFCTQCYVRFTVHELILLNCLRQIKFGKLEEVFILKPIWQFHNAHDLELEELGNPQNITLPFGIKSSELVGFLLENGKTIKKFGTQPEKFRPFGCQNDEFKDRIDQLQFEELNCNVWGEGESLVIEHQKKLKEMVIFASCRPWQGLATAIHTSASTLVKIDIYFKTEWNYQLANPPQWQQLDASAFIDCSKLESLDLYTGNSILNLATLPDCIQSLSLKARLTQEDLLSIASKLCNLKIVKCFHPIVIHEEPIFFNSEIIEAFLGIESLVGLIAVDFSGNADDIANITKSHEGKFEFFHMFYSIHSSDMVMEIWTTRECALRPTEVPVHF